MPAPPGPGLRYLARKMEHLIAVIPQPGGKSRYTNDAISRELAGLEPPVTVSAQYIALLRNGQRNNPSLILTRGLATLFGVPMEYFVDDLEVEASINAQLETVQRLRDTRVEGLMLRGEALDPESLKQIAALLAEVQDIAEGRPRAKRPDQDTP